MTVLREFLQQGHLRALDLAHNSLDDESSFSLLTSLTETETTETTETKVAPSAPAPLSVFLGENFVRNPPALLERLRRVGLRVKLDEVVNEFSSTRTLYLPYLCFQKAIKSELPIEPTYQFKWMPREVPDAQQDHKLNGSTDLKPASTLVDSALRSLKNMLPSFPSFLSDQSVPSFTTTSPGQVVPPPPPPPPSMANLGNSATGTLSTPATPTPPMATAGTQADVAASATSLSPFLEEMKETIRKYEAALLGDDKETPEPEAPWKSQRRRLRRSSIP